MKRWWQWLVIAYLVLLGSSHLYRLTMPETGTRLPGQKTLEVPRVYKTGKNVMSLNTDVDPVTIAYRDLQPGNPNAPVLLLLHGSPLASRAWDDMIPYLENEFRLVIPDLPGFGGSSLDIPNYSMQAHGLYMSEFLENLDIRDAHAVAYSQAGGVALWLNEYTPGRLSSITMLAAVGVQELELMGNYGLNRALYGLQWAVLALIQEGFPHFGWMDTFPVNRAYARNFYDSDQRPLRNHLEQAQLPLLILQGESDTFVPPAVSREHYRIVPHSEYAGIDGDHLMQFRQPEVVARPLIDFVDRVEAGLAKSRPDATAERLAAAAEPHQNIKAPRAEGFLFFILVALIILTTLLSEDLACIGAGLLAARGTLSLSTAILSSFGGIFIGDLLLYAAGRFFGRAALRRPPLRWIVTEAAEKRAERWFKKRGALIILISRFTPGTRAATFFSAGVLHRNFWKFLLVFFIAASLWTPALVTLTYWLGEGAYKLYETYSLLLFPSLVATAVFLYAFTHFGLPLVTWRGRRQVLGRWRRLTRWEYWPVWFFDSVLFFYIFYRSFFRSPRPAIFTATNPGIPPDSGFLGESKTQILKSMEGLGEVVGQWTDIPGSIEPEKRINTLDTFMEENSLDYPVALKMDEGQRGLGVEIVHNREHAVDYLQRTRTDSIVQEYIPGKEFGVFYIRYPDQDEGFIYSITEKVLPTVTGDGESTVEQLILAKDETVAMAPAYLNALKEKSEDIPAKDEVVHLIELGTHARGAIFYDGRKYNTEPLRKAIDQICRKFPGFYFGRMDVRAPSLEDFMAGRNLRIIEINGITSEATHIYSPGTKLWQAYRTLFEQWRLCFEVGRQNAEKGVPVMKALPFIFYWIKAYLQQRHLKGAIESDVA